MLQAMHMAKLKIGRESQMSDTESVDTVHSDMSEDSYKSHTSEKFSDCDSLHTEGTQTALLYHSDEELAIPKKLPRFAASEDYIPRGSDAAQIKVCMKCLANTAESCFSHQIH